MLSACTQRTICPAFQSAYIYDKDALRKKFSYFQEDSTPKILTASKNKYLIAEAVPYRKKLNSLATIEMKDVNPSVPDSLLFDDDVSIADLDRAARSVIDSTYIVDVEQPQDSIQDDADSVYVITVDREVRVLKYDRDSVEYSVDEVRYNTDQDNYMWYLRNSLVLPDVRLASMQGKWEEEAAAEEEKRKKKEDGFFARLFGKKDKEEKEMAVPQDSVEMEPAVERSEFDFEYNENEEPVEPVVEEDEPKQKKGFFSFLKKDKTKEAKRSNSDDKELKRQRVKEKKQKKEKKPEPQKAAPEEEQADPPQEEKSAEEDGF